MKMAKSGPFVRQIETNYALAMINFDRFLTTAKLKVAIKMMVADAIAIIQIT